MARVYAGEVLGLVKPTAGQTVELKVFLQDSTGAALTGQTFDAAGMTVAIAKPGAAYVAWLTIVGNAFATGNWQEVGYGVYNVVLSGDTAGEANLLNTPGDLAVYVKNTASKGDNFLFRVVPADVARDDQWTDARAAYLDTLNTFMAGITSLAAWLRGLARKDAMDATAKTELNSGGGAYDEATDSGQALRDTAPMGSAMYSSVMRGTDNAALATVCTETRLAELDAANLPANVDTLLARLGAWTGTGTNTLLGAIKALASKVAAAVSDIGGTFSPADDSLEAIRDRGDAAWLGETGNGANTITVTVKTAGGIVYEGVKVSLTNQAETTTALVIYTNASGQAVFYVDAGAWRAVAPANGAQSGGATNFTVDGAEAVTVTVTAANIPAPVSTNNYLLYDYERKVEADAVFGAAAMTVKVERVSVDAQTDATANAMRAIMGTSYSTDATGYWGFEIAKTLANSYITIKKTWTNASGKARTETWTGKVLATKANLSSQICFADLLPERVASS